MKIDCPETINHLPKELVDFARRQIVNAILNKGDERRDEGRHHMMLPVVAVPIDLDNQPAGAAFDLITRDVSASTISLIHSEKIVGQRLAVQLRIAGETVNIVIEIVWSEALGPFYGAGGEFRDKLDYFPA